MGTGAPSTLAMPSARTRAVAVDALWAPNSVTMSIGLPAGYCSAGLVFGASCWASPGSAIIVSAAAARATRRVELRISILHSCLLCHPQPVLPHLPSVGRPTPGAPLAVVDGLPTPSRILHLAVVRAPHRTPFMTTGSGRNHGSPGQVRAPPFCPH